MYDFYHSGSLNNYVCYKILSDGSIDYIGYEDNAWHKLSRNAHILDDGKEYEAFYIKSSGSLYFARSGNDIYPEIEPGKKSGTTPPSSGSPALPSSDYFYYIEGDHGIKDSNPIYICMTFVYSSSSHAEYMGYDNSNKRWVDLTRTTKTENGKEIETFNVTSTGALFYSRSSENLFTPAANVSTAPKGSRLPIPLLPEELEGMTDPSDPSETSEPTESAKPEEPAESSESSEPSEPSETSDPADDVEETKPADQVSGSSGAETKKPDVTTEHTDKPDRSTPAETTKQAETVKPAETTEPAAPAETTEPSKPQSETTKPETSKPEATKPETTKPKETVRPSTEPAETSKPTQAQKESGPEET